MSALVHLCRLGLLVLLLLLLLLSLQVVELLNLLCFLHILPEETANGWYEMHLDLQELALSCSRGSVHAGSKADVVGMH